MVKLKILMSFPMKKCFWYVLSSVLSLLKAFRLIPFHDVNVFAYIFRPSVKKDM